MDALIHRVSHDLGVSQSRTISALCNILHLIRQQADAELADEFICRLPSAQELLGISQAPDITGLDTGYESRAARGPADPYHVLQVIACLSHAGLDIDVGRALLVLFVEFAKEHAGPRLVGRLMDDLTGLDILLRSGQHGGGPDLEQRPGLQSDTSEVQLGRRLEAAGISTLGQLLHACATPDGRRLVAEATAIDPAQLLQFLELASSNRWCGLTKEVVRILEAADIGVLKDKPKS